MAHQPIHKHKPRCNNNNRKEHKSEKKILIESPSAVSACTLRLSDPDTSEFGTPSNKAETSVKYVERISRSYFWTGWSGSALIPDIKKDTFLPEESQYRIYPKYSYRNA